MEKYTNSLIPSEVEGATAQAFIIAVLMVGHCPCDRYGNRKNSIVPERNLIYRILFKINTFVRFITGIRTAVFNCVIVMADRFIKAAKLAF